MSRTPLTIVVLSFVLAGTAGCAGTPSYSFQQKSITVDGDPADWEGIPEEIVEGAEHLWFGQGMTPEKWLGNEDHSFRWRGTWSDGRLYFLFVVTDDIHVDPAVQPNSFLNDCIEIIIDPLLRKGPRFVEADGRKTLRGYEMHFLPSSPPLVFIDDALSPMYPLERPQNELFEREWRGEVAARMTPTGYVMEIAFSIPDVALEEGMVFGLETGVCDDDGEGRKSLQMWTGRRVEFWLTMDHYGEARLAGGPAREGTGSR